MRPTILWKHRTTAATVLLSLAFAAIVGAAGFFTNYNNTFPALGGPNALLYDLTLKASLPWRQARPTPPAVLVAVDEESLAAPELAALPRAMFQPIWARLIEGALDAGARRIAFDTVFAYAGADFRAGSYTLPDYDRPLLDALAKHRDRVVIGRFPGVAPATPFALAVGSSRIGVLDIQVESDGRARSVAPVVQLSDGRIGVGFAVLGAGINIRQASGLRRILIAPTAPIAETPTYSLATLLDCLASPKGAARVRQALEGRIVVVGTAVLGEDEHRGPTRFMGVAKKVESDACSPASGAIRRASPEAVPGAFLQIAAIQAAASGGPVTLAPPWLRFSAAVLLALSFAIFAFRNENALAIGESDVSAAWTIALHILRAFALGMAGPALAGGAVAVGFFVAADMWLPMGYPILATSFVFAAIVSLRSARHRILFNRLYRTAGRYLPPARLVHLAREGFANPPQGQEREVSMLLVDLIGFTTFSNQPGRNPADVVRTANAYFTLMQEAIDHHGGCSDKFLGDAVLAFWNGLTDDPDHAARAVATALEIITNVNEGSVPSVHRLTVRAVVCTGKVYVGDLGAEQRSNFTVIGPAVNETFRLERVPDMYGLPLAIAATTAAAITARRTEDPTERLLANGVLVRIDDLELKGFDGVRSIFAYVPQDDPGLSVFEAGREALDRGLLQEGLTHLSRVGSGCLLGAATVVSERHRRRALAVHGAAE